MSGIECINLLAFIQFIIAFDFGLYYLDNKHVLTEIYRKYQKDLKLSVRAVLSRANDIITESLKSENSECILNSAYLDKAYRRLKYLTDENQLDLEGCGFIGLYAGLYGFLCLFCIGMFGSQHEALVKTYILVTSQIVLVIELFISGYNLYQEDCRKYSRNLWSNIRFIFFITLFVVGIVSFDWTYKFFSEFEFPFVVISLIVLLFPLILFIGHIVISRIIVTFVIIKCTFDSNSFIFLCKDFLQSVQCHIGKRGRDNATLWRSLLCREHLFVEDIAAFQPFSEYCLVHRDVGKQPFMADMVEAPLYVTLQNPFGRIAFSENVMALHYRVHTAAFLAETV